MRGWVHVLLAEATLLLALVAHSRLFRGELSGVQKTHGGSCPFNLGSPKRNQLLRPLIRLDQDSG